MPVQSKPKPNPKLVFFAPTLLLGGAERHTVDLVGRLRARGFDCTILVHSKLFSPVVTSMPAAAGAEFLGIRGMSEMKGWWNVWRTLHRMNPDAIICINQTTLIISVLERFLCATKAKLGCIFHTTEMQSFEAYQARLMRWVSPFTDLMVYLGESQRRTWDARGIRARRTVVIANGVDFERFKPDQAVRHKVRSELGIGDEFLIGMVAAFRPEKNHLEFVEGLAAAKMAGVRPMALFIGGGETQNSVARRAEELGVGDQLLFLGVHDNVAPYVAACDAGALTSVAETFPLATLEMLASGVPMLAANIDGALELVKHDVNGLVYQAGASAELGSAIVAMADPETRNRLAAASRYSVTRYSVDTSVDHYVEAINAMLNT